MLREIARRIILNMSNAHFGTWDMKFLAVSKLSFVPAFLIYGFSRITDWYIMNEWYMSAVLIVVAIDHGLGTWVHWFIKKDWSTKENLKGLFTKVTMAMLGYIIFELMYVIITPVEMVSDYFRVVIQLMVMLYPGLSAMGNMSVITKGKFPPIGWINKFSQFNQSGDLNELKTTKNSITEYYHGDTTQDTEGEKED